MNLLITGGAGFIGSHFIKHMIETHPAHSIVNVDYLTYAGSLERLKEVENNPSYSFIQATILDTEKMKQIMQEYEIEVVIHFAAESHVDRSIQSSYPFLKTNVEGTVSLLEAAKEASIQKFIQISTDEVYGAIQGNGVDETAPLNPGNPYSASKASADMFVQSYGKTYDLPVIITRCSNNYGTYHFPEKFIPLCITQALEGKSLPLYGKGKQRRTWLHVRDHCKAIEKVLYNGKIGEIYNISGIEERENRSVAEAILTELNDSPSTIQFVEDRLGHDFRYAMDSTKIKEECDWEPTISFEEGLRETIDWYKGNESWWKKLK